MINDANPSTTGGVFSKGADQLLDKLETGPDYKIATAFLVFAALFFFASITALPFILIAPRQFNLYFCFGSIFLQIALAFFYAPAVYMRKLFSEENRAISGVYIVSLLIDLYFIMAGAGYLLTILLVGLQACSLGWFVMQAVGGGERASSWAYAMMFAAMVEKMKAMVPGAAGGQANGGDSGLPI